MPATTVTVQRLRRSRLGLVLFLAVAITGSGALPFAVVANAVRSGRAIDLVFAAVALTAPLRAEAAGLPTGSDGRFTILLLGSDFRTHKPGNGDRTDMIMVLTINPNTGKMAVASIPRDTAQIPLKNGTTHKGRINELFKKYAPSGRAVALDKVRADLAHALGVEIDAAALIRFVGFDALMDELGQVTVTTRSAKDPKLWDRDPVGVLFPAASNWVLVGSPTTEYPNCRGWWWHSPAATSNSGYECHRALMYARTRKGKANSDFKRQARGADIVLAAIAKVTNSSYGSSKLQDVVDEAGVQSSASGKPWALTTTANLPINLTTATALYNLYKGANGSNVNRVVFKPSKYSTHISGTATYKMNVTKVRKWIDLYFQNI